MQTKSWIKYLSAIFAVVFIAGLFLPFVNNDGKASSLFSENIAIAVILAVLALAGALLFWLDNRVSPTVIGIVEVLLVFYSKARIKNLEINEVFKKASAATGADKTIKTAAKTVAGYMDFNTVGFYILAIAAAAFLVVVAFFPNIFKDKKIGQLDTQSLHNRRLTANIVLILLCVMCLIWFYMLLVNTTRSNDELGKFSLIPSSHLIDNFKHLFFGTKQYNVIEDFRLGLLNSAIVAVGSSLLSVYFSAMTAYAIHAYDFKLKKIFYTFILAIMMVPTQVTILGFLDLVDNLGMKNTFWPLILPAVAAPACFFYMKQYMDSVLPMAIVESARIDGAGEFKTFNSIILPIMKPAIAVQIIFSFVGSWNNYFTPALILIDVKKKTLPIMIAGLNSSAPANFDGGRVNAAITFSIFPVAVVYLCLSKFIVGGVAMGSVKG